MHSLIDAVGILPNALQAKEIGRMAAKLFTLRNMSLAVTAQLEAGANPTWAASCVKDLGVTLEQEIPELAQLIQQSDVDSTEHQPTLVTEET